MTRDILNAAFIQSNPVGKNLKISEASPISAEGIKSAPVPEARDAYNRSISDDIANIKEEIEKIKSIQAERNAAGVSEKETSDVKTTRGFYTAAKSALSAAAGFATGYVIGEITNNMEKAETEQNKGTGEKTPDAAAPPSGRVKKASTAFIGGHKEIVVDKGRAVTREISGKVDGIIAVDVYGVDESDSSNPQIDETSKLFVAFSNHGKGIVFGDKHIGIMDNDARKNLQCTVSKNGDLTILNQGEKSESQVTIRKIVPRSMREKVQKELSVDGLKNVFVTDFSSMLTPPWDSSRIHFSSEMKDMKDIAAEKEWESSKNK
ncbi:MAG: hypothetical protein AB9903_03670 [Vulcanimicrobiota bacterium]